MLPRLFPAWLKLKTQTRRPSAVARHRLRVEPLEAREMPSVTMASIADQQMASDRPFFLPLTVTNTPNGTPTYTVDTGNPNLTAQVLSGTTVQFDVTNGLGVNGTLTIQLFDNVAPDAVNRIVTLINQNPDFYVGKQLFRVEDLGASPESNVIVQGGGANNTDNSSLPALEEEFNKDFTFASNGLFALAKTSFPDSSNSQFFFTDINRPLSDRLESFNYRYTLLGQLTAGFDVYTAIKAAPRTGTQPTPNITITGARVLSSTPNRVIEFIPAAGGFTGTTAVTVTANDADNTPTTATFNLTGMADPNGNSQPFLNEVPDTMTAVAGQPTTLTVSSFDRENDPVTYVVRNYNPGQASDFSTTPANLSVAIDQSTGKITLTPAASFTGTIQFRIGVRQANAADSPGNYAAQLVTMTVTAPTSSPASPPPPTGSFTVTGSAPGSEPRVVATNADGSVRFDVLAFDPSFTGGVHIARGDVDGDGKEDIVVTPGFGGAPIFEVLDETTGVIKFSRMVFEDTFRGGLFLSVADGRGLGYAQVLVGAGETGGPRVTLYDVKTDRVLENFFASDSATRGGTTVDLAVVFPSQGFFIVTAAGPGSGPLVSFFSPVTSQLIGDFLAGDPNNRDGIRARVDPNLNTTTNSHHILVAPFHSTGTTGEVDYDPALAKSPTSTKSSSIDTTNINSLLQQSNGG